MAGATSSARSGVRFGSEAPSLGGAELSANVSWDNVSWDNVSWETEASVSAIAVLRGHRK
jgi:hypothetical protein